VKLDPMLQNFMNRQYEIAADLAQRSDILDLFWISPLNAVARLACTGLVREQDGSIREHFGFELGVSFSEEWLRYVGPLNVVSILAPRNIAHPNCRAPGACLGEITPGTEIDDLLYRAFEVITWQSFTVDENDALDWDMCAWGRQHMDDFPCDSRPLLWKQGDPVPPTPMSSSERHASWGTP
jgi:hypothetical protein